MSKKTVVEVKEQIQELIANNKIAKAISLLIDHFKGVDDDPR
ncbi:MAG: hypothetical protein ACJA01_004424 [Saprospiraceae bacterium]|jgi:hypothetical protein